MFDCMSYVLSKGLSYVSMIWILKHVKLQDELWRIRNVIIYTCNTMFLLLIYKQKVYCYIWLL